MLQQLQLTSMWQHECVDIYHWIPLSRTEGDRPGGRAGRASLQDPAQPLTLGITALFCHPLAQSPLLRANDSHWLVLQVRRRGGSEISTLHASFSLGQKDATFVNVIHVSRKATNMYICVHVCVYTLITTCIPIYVCASLFLYIYISISIPICSC